MSCNQSVLVYGQNGNGQSSSSQNVSTSSSQSSQGSQSISAQSAPVEQESPATSVLELMQRACAYARSIISIEHSSTSIEHNRLPDGEKTKWKSRICRLRKTTSDLDGGKLSATLVIADRAQVAKAGNCSEFARLVIKYLTLPSTKYNLHLDTYAKVVHIDGGDHAFVIVNTNSAATPGNYYNYANDINTVVCDAWSGECYLGNQISEKLHDADCVYRSAAGGRYVINMLRAFNTRPDRQEQKIEYTGTCVRVFKDGGYEDASIDAAQWRNVGLTSEAHKIISKLGESRKYLENMDETKWLPLFAEHMDNNIELIIKTLDAVALYAGEHALTTLFRDSQALVGEKFSITDYAKKIKKMLDDITRFAEDNVDKSDIIFDIGLTCMKNNLLDNPTVFELISRCVAAEKYIGPSSLDDLYKLLTAMEKAKILTQSNIDKIVALEECSPSLADFEVLERINKHLKDTAHLPAGDDQQKKFDTFIAGMGASSPVSSESHKNYISADKTPQTDTLSKFGAFSSGSATASSEAVGKFAAPVTNTDSIDDSGYRTDKAPSPNVYDGDGYATGGARAPNASDDDARNTRAKGDFDIDEDESLKSNLGFH